MALFSRAQYEIIQQTLRSVADNDPTGESHWGLEACAKALAEALARDSRSFDRKRFMREVFGESLAGRDVNNLMGNNL